MSDPSHPLRWQSKATGSIFVFEIGAQKVLMLQFDIDCPECGQQRIQILGHHLRALREIVRTAFDTYPELLGEESSLTIVDTTAFSGTAGDPSKN